ncbi:choice-of-anchor D domain-containing protein [Solicola sp. PLA-1-18]|uniref:choice-of-anchor D domain-containing protein n=1 Tax=Solicola sp. PLA-1-18 TaxID=3380532 RepID=UPI003B774A0B
MALTGTGTSTAPAPTPPVLVISESAHDFGYDDAPAPHVFTVTNTGAGTATAVTTILTGDPAFVAASTCGAVLPSTSSCSVRVTYTGSGTTQQSARLDVVSDNGGTVGADLKGSPVALSVTPAEHAFGEVAVGSTSQSAPFVLTNHRLTSVTLSESTAGPFDTGDSCDAVVVAAGGTCTFTATFSPTAAGPVGGDVSYASGTDRAEVELSGAGTTPAALSVSASVSDLGAYEVGGTPGTSVLTVTNTGTTSTGAIDADLDGSVDDFAVTGSTCPATLPGGGSCEITVAFSPASNGDKSVDVAVSGAPGNTVTLVGLGAPAGVSLVPASYDYGAQPVGSTTLKTFRVVNTTDTSQPMSSASSGPPFPFELNEDFTCVLVISDIPSHRWCTMTISFKPQSVGAFSTTLTAGGNSFNTTSTLFGTGVSAAGRAALRRTASTDTGGASRIELKNGKAVVSR